MKKETLQHIVDLMEKNDIDKIEIVKFIDNKIEFYGVKDNNSIFIKIEQNEFDDVITKY